mgnify:CR=1 FL=1
MVDHSHGSARSATSASRQGPRSSSSSGAARRRGAAGGNSTAGPGMSSPTSCVDGGHAKKWRNKPWDGPIKWQGCLAGFFALALGGSAALGQEHPTIDDGPLGPQIEGYATHYGESYNGQRMGCSGAPYRSEDPTILAVGPGRYAAWPCGTRLLVTGPVGEIVVTRQDSCPGCAPNVLDLSERGNELVCGAPPHTCRVTIRVLDPN